MPVFFAFYCKVLNLCPFHFHLSPIMEQPPKITQQRLNDTINEHYKFVESLFARDHAAAERAIENHFNNAQIFRDLHSKQLNNEPPQL